VDEPPLSSLEEQFASWIQEALELRYGSESEIPAYGSDPQVVFESLLDTRRKIDRVEGILASVEQANGRVDRMLAVTEFARDAAWDEALKANRKAGIRGGGSDFQGPRERYADANLATLKERRDAHEIDVLSRSAKTAATVVRQCLRGLNGVREDHLAILRAMNIGTRLET
jgi:hypothetical protein